MSHSKASKGLQWDRTFSTITLNGGADCVGRDWSQKVDFKVKGGALIRKTLCAAGGLDVGNLKVHGITIIGNTLEGNPGNLIVQGNVVADGNVAGGNWRDVNINGNLTVNNVIYYDNTIQQVLFGNCLVDNDKDTKIFTNDDNTMTMVAIGSSNKATLFPNGAFKLHEYTSASGDFSFSEGYNTTAIGFASHAEGFAVKALGYASHAQGYYSYVTGRGTHVESYTYPYYIGGKTCHVESPVINIGSFSHNEIDFANEVGNICHNESYDSWLYPQLCHVDTSQFAWSSSVQGLDHFQGDSMYCPANNVTKSLQNGLNHSAATIGYNFGYCSHISRGAHVVANSGDYAHCTGRGAFTNQHAVWGMGTSDGEQDYLVSIPRCESNLTGQYQVTMYHLRTKIDGIESGNLSLKYPEIPEVYPEVTYAPPPPNTADEIVGGPTAFPPTNSALQIFNGNPSILFRSSSTTLEYQRSDNNSGDSWPGSFVIYSGDSIEFESLANISGNPAVCFKNNNLGSLEFLRSDDINGDSWTGNVINVDIDTDSFYFNYLSEVNGNVAITFIDRNTNQLKFVRSTDSLGTTWLSPVIITTGILYTSQPHQKLTIKIVDGFPAISYTDFSGSAALKFVRALDANGDTWDSPITVVSGNNGIMASMDIVNGNPAIAYLSSNLVRTYYVRANDSVGSTWGLPYTLASWFSTSWDYCDPSLKVICGVPMVVYSWIRTTSTRVTYLSVGNNADGTSFSRTEIFNGFRSKFFNLVELNDSPAFLSYNTDNSLLEFKASTNCGVTWGCISELQNVRHQIWKVDLTISGKDTFSGDCFGQKIYFTAYHNGGGNEIIIADVFKKQAFSTGTLVGSSINVLKDNNFVKINVTSSSINETKWAGTMYVTNAGIQDYADRYFDDFFLNS